jgi:GNAT superfamily N-acetyltransferase
VLEALVVVLPQGWLVAEGRIRIAPARMDELPIAAGILDEASAWLESRGFTGWPRPFPVAALEAALALGPTYLAWDGRTAVATFSLHRTDVRFWGERPGEAPGHARYLHKLAIRRSHAGLGRELLGLAERFAREGGAVCLRLDCVAGNPVIRGYYEAAGFEYRGQVSGPAFEVPYALYEKPLG